MTQLQTINLGTHIPGMDETTPFPLWKAEVTLLRVYVEAGLRLPRDSAELAPHLGISPEKAEKFQDILQVFKQIHEHCASFEQKVYPNCVELAGHITSYNKDVQTYYPELSQFATEWRDAQKVGNAQKQQSIAGDFKTIIEELQQPVSKYIEKVSLSSQEVKGFFDLIRQDQLALEPLAKKYKDQFITEQGELAKLAKEIEETRQKIEKLNQEYEYHNWKAHKQTLYYAWLGPIGAGVALEMLLKHGQTANEIKHELASLKEQLKQAEGGISIESVDARLQEVENYLSQARKTLKETRDLSKIAAPLDEIRKRLEEVKNAGKAAKESERLAVFMVREINQARGCILGIIEQQQAVLQILQQLQGNWVKLASELKQAAQQVGQGLPDSFASSDLPKAIQSWKELSTKANLYYSHAYIKFMSESELAEELKKHQSA